MGKVTAAMHRAKQRQLTSRVKAALPDNLPKPAHPTAKQPAYDPRLKWARPEWIKPQQDSSSSSSTGPGISSQQPSRTPPLLKPKQQKLLNRVTYGAFSSSESDEEFHSSSDISSWQDNEQYPQLFQALGIDFGVQRVGIAVRRSSHNVPLLTLHRQQQQQQQQVDHNSSTGSADDDNDKQQPQGQQQQKQCQRQMITLQRTAAAILQLALQEGCDGFIVGLPVYSPQQHQVTGAAAAAAAKQQTEATLNSIIRSFAMKLAKLAAPLQLPVYLVNEQQSSQQARAVMSGAASYDIRTQYDLEQEQRAAEVQQQQQQQQEEQSSRRLRYQQNNKIGRDAFAAALILSRYYNGLVTPIEQALPQDGLPGNSSSSSSTSRSWGKKQQRQAADDLKFMMVHPGEQRRRQKQRERMLADNAQAATAALAAAEVGAAAEAEAIVIADQSL